MQLTAKKILTYVLVIGFVASIACYGYYQSRELRRGPQITVAYPQDGALLDDTFITLRGTVENAAFIRLRGRQIYTNPAGEFSESLLLYPGYNIITVAVKDAFGRIRQKQITVVVDEQPEQPRLTQETARDIIAPTRARGEANSSNGRRL